jgi:hypothetical protein
VISPPVSTYQTTNILFAALVLVLHKKRYGYLGCRQQEDQAFHFIFRDREPELPVIDLDKSVLVQAADFQKALHRLYADLNVERRKSRAFFPSGGER